MLAAFCLYHACCRHCHGLVWKSITGYMRSAAFSSQPLQGMTAGSTELNAEFD